MAPKSKLKNKLSEKRATEIKDAVLGKRYELSLVFVSAQRIREVNRTYRGKDISTDILSFPLSKTSGEILLSIPDVRRKAKKFERTFDNYLEFLLIHGLCHLKGMTHGSTMERAERKFREKFGV